MNIIRSKFRVLFVLASRGSAPKYFAKGGPRTLCSKSTRSNDVITVEGKKLDVGKDAPGITVHREEALEMVRPTDPRSIAENRGKAENRPMSKMEEDEDEEDPIFPAHMDREMVYMWKDSPGGREWNGPRGYEPTRFGDWACNGRVSDF